MYPLIPLQQAAMRAVNRLGKWRSVFAGWQLGTRPDTDPECQAVRDHREATIMLRVELTALTQALVESGVLSRELYLTKLLDECERHEKINEERFPGFKATDIGMDINVAKAAETTKGWRP